MIILQNGTDYFEIPVARFRTLLIYNSAGKNREHFANELLMEVTRALKGERSFYDNEISERSGNRRNVGWRDCSDIKNMVQQQVINI